MTSLLKSGMPSYLWGAMMVSGAYTMMQAPIASACETHVNIEQSVRGCEEFSALLWPSYVYGTQDKFNKGLLRVQHDLNAEEVASAKKAMADAIRMLKIIPTKNLPFVTITDEGVALVRWRSDKGGIVLLFHGDKEVTVSTNVGGVSYLEDVAVCDISTETGKKIAATVSAIGL